MVRAELMGGHTHPTTVGINVHIYRRAGKFLARGRYQRRMFGVDLGSETIAAQSALRRLLTEIEAGTFQPPSEARRQAFKTRQVPQLDLRGLCNAFLAEKRKLRGRRTADDYRNRLAPILDFAELKASLKRWPLAADIDREFVAELRDFLINRQITRNGCPGAPSKPMSVRQVINCLETLRTAVTWGCRADVRKLPPEFANPVAQDIIGSIPPKDPLRTAKLPLDRRLALLATMDEWQFTHLAILLVLPLRFEDASGALISDVDFGGRTLRLGTRFGGSDFNKGKVDVLMPLPIELMPLLRVCAGGRSEGPLFRTRANWSGSRKAKLSVDSHEQLEQLLNKELATAPAGKVQAEQDRKVVFRELLRKMGGMSESYPGKQLRALIQDRGTRPYDLRGSITDDMKRSQMNHLELRYLTEHSVSDIINEYTGLVPAVEMKKYFRKIRPLLEAIQDRGKTLSAGAEPVHGGETGLAGPEQAA